MNEPTYVLGEPLASVFTNGPTFAEIDALLAKLAALYPPPPPLRLLLASVDDVHTFRDLIGAEERKPQPLGFIGPPLIGIPIVIDKDMPEGVMELRAGTTARRFTLYGDALTREREATLARFLTTDEEPEDAANDKPVMEPECLRTRHGRCHRCKLTRPLFRYEIDPRHRQFLGCTCDDGDICGTCFSGMAALDGTDFIVCGGCFMTPPVCTWSEWLERRALPWLCAHCWKAVIAEEIEHIGVLEAANPF